MSVWVNFADIYMLGMRDRSMRGGRELSGEIQLTYWSTAGEKGKLFFCGFAQAIIGAIYFSFHSGKKNRFPIVQFLFVILIQFVPCAFQENL